MTTNARADDLRGNQWPQAGAPTPPRDGIAARIQQMPPAGRWALSLGLAFLSGVAFLISPWMGSGGLLAVVVFPLALFPLTLAAGFALSSWWAVAPLTVTAAAGMMLAGFAQVWMAPGGMSKVGGDAAMLASSTLYQFAILGLAPTILFLLSGVGLAKQQGIALGEPRILQTREAGVIQWLAALGPVAGAAYLAPPVRFIPIAQFDVAFTIAMTVYAVLLAATCLMAGWQLHSWWGLVTAPVVYVGVAALASLTLPWFGAGFNWSGWAAGFALYIALPAVVMAAIGTGLGMSGGRQTRQRPTRLAT